jgi:hypothetical protein
LVFGSSTAAAGSSPPMRRDGIKEFLTGLKGKLTEQHVFLKFL